MISSSLHGIIVADALGVPNARIKFDADIDDFKSNDYYSSVRQKGTILLSSYDDVAYMTLLRLSRNVNLQTHNCKATAISVGEVFSCIY